MGRLAPRAMEEIEDPEVLEVLERAERLIDGHEGALGPAAVEHARQPVELVLEIGVRQPPRIGLVGQDADVAQQPDGLLPVGLGLIEPGIPLRLILIVVRQLHPAVGGIILGLPLARPFFGDQRPRIGMPGIYLLVAGGGQSGHHQSAFSRCQCTSHEQEKHYRHDAPGSQSGRQPAGHQNRCPRQ